jgi:hypothetical protein
MKRAPRAIALLALAGVIGGGLLVVRARHRRHARRLSPPSERSLVRAAMAARPGDPWPRGRGHVLLAIPGTRDADKGYHEPGGSFSPGVGSFGVAIWSVGDADGRLTSSSDSVPLAEVQQRFEPAPDATRPPSIVDETPRFHARWTAESPGRYRLDLTPRLGSNEHISLAIRSVGPAGGPIRSLAYDHGVLQIGDRWSIALSPAPTSVKLGQEPTTRDGPAPNGGAGAWWSTGAAPGTANSRWEGASGWGFALLSWNGPAQPAQVTATISDRYPTPVDPLAPYPTSSSVTTVFPEARFAASLDAQVANLLMSLSGRQTRPGDPTNYPLSWLRDGAHIMVALARAGRADVACELVSELGVRDFFGGFGPEADGPGVGIWAMDEVAGAAHAPAVDRWVYPHIHRKAELILDMLDARTEMHHEPIEGPIVPSWRQDRDLSLVCEAARDGLIVGRMDGHRPLLYVNAMSYLGLRRASAMAGRLGDAPSAHRYASRAEALRAAWLRANHPPDSDNDRTYISALWPTWIGASQRDTIRARLDARWAKDRTADGGYRQLQEWTYFDFAEAHQWLALGEADRMWTTLRQFWDHQVSPGLFTWSEGHGEENSFGLWENVRGWVDPPHVTPHYWTAAEALLLQLDALAYVDDSEATPVVVVGAGVEAAWVSQPLSASGVGTRLGAIDWSWRDGILDVTIHGATAAVRAGAAFGAHPVVHVRATDPLPWPKACALVR